MEGVINFRISQNAHAITHALRNFSLQPCKDGFGFFAHYRRVRGNARGDDRLLLGKKRDPGRGNRRRDDDRGHDLHPQHRRAFARHRRNPRNRSPAP